MTDTSAPSDYDKLPITRVLFFVAFIMLINLLVVATVYPFQLGRPFHTVLSREDQLHGRFLGAGLRANARWTGDRLYNAALVKTGAEKLVYEEMLPATDDPVERAVKKVGVFAQIADNIFDYLLLLSYRFGFFAMCLPYVAALLVCSSLHGMISRHRRRFGFGDTPLVANLWSRGLLAYALPILFIIYTLPVALGPIVLLTSLAVSTLAAVAFVLSLPKLA